MNIFDHAFIVLFAVIYPISGYFSFRKLKRRIAAGAPVNRKHLYDMTIVGHWALFAIALVLWALLDRAWADLGFSLVFDARFFAGTLLTVIGIVFLVVQLRQVADAGPEYLRDFRSQIESVEMLVPRNGNELGRFYAVSVTAGVVEETLWRGFLIWYLAHVMPVWAAAVVSAVGFGVAHAYQGKKNVPKIAAVGAVFVIVYLVSGSLLLPIVLHAAVDLFQGRTAYEVVNHPEFNNPADTDGNTVEA